MRIKLYFDLEEEEMPIDYRNSILSYFKHSLSEYNQEEFKKLYNERESIVKSYTFAVFFNRPKFTKDKVIIKDKKMELNLSIYDYHTAITLYNSFNHQKNKRFSLNRNSIILKNISLIEEKEIFDNSIIVKFLSPVIARSRNREIRRDYYYSYIHSEFKETLYINIKATLEALHIPEDILEGFDIIPIKPKKTVVKFYEKQIEGTLGIFELKGKRELLQFIYLAGLGSRRSSGFGMFTILKNI